MRCEQAQLWFSAKLDGELDEERQRLLEAHLGRCVRCRDFAAQMEGLSDNLATVGAPEPSADFASKVMSHIQDVEVAAGELAGASSGLGVPRFLQVGLAAASFGLGVLLSFYAWSFGNGAASDDLNGYQPTAESIDEPEEYVAYLWEDELDETLLALLPQAED